MALLGYMLVCSFTPGPGNILALNTTSTYGWKNSRRLLLGICAGYAVVQALCTLALCGLNQVFCSALELLRYVGGLYMVWLAVHIVRSRPQNAAAEGKPTFREGFLLQLVNVKIYFYISSLLTVYFIPNLSSWAALAGAGAFAVSIGCLACLAWAFLGSGMQALYHRHFSCINILLGLFLLYCAGSMIVRR